MGDVSPDGKAVLWKVGLDPKLTKGGRGGVAFLIAGVREELRRYLRWKRRAIEPLETRSPLFLSNQGRRISLRRIQFVFRKWQSAAGFESLYPFHALRHSAITNVYRATKDLYLTQRFARHASPLTTAGLHPSHKRGALRGPSQPEGLTGRRGSLKVRRRRTAGARNPFRFLHYYIGETRKRNRWAGAKRPTAACGQVFRFRFFLIIYREKRETESPSGPRGGYPQAHVELLLGKTAENLRRGPASGTLSTRSSRD